MYRQLVVLLMVAVLVFSSCSPAVSTPVTSGFQCRLETVLHNTKVAAYLDLTSTARTSLHFSEPAELQGMTMLYENGCVSVTYLGLSVEFDCEQFPDGALFQKIFNVFDYLKSETSTDLSGLQDIAGADLQFDKQTGLPCSLTFRDPAIVILFSEWRMPEAETNETNIYL